MSALLDAGPEVRQGLLTASLLLLLAATACFAAAATRTRRQPGQHATSRRTYGRRATIAVLLSAIVGAFLTPAPAAATTCVPTSIGTCVQTPILNLGGTNSNAGSAGTGKKPAPGSTAKANGGITPITPVKVSPAPKSTKASSNPLLGYGSLGTKSATTGTPAKPKPTTTTISRPDGANFDAPTTKATPAKPRPTKAAPTTRGKPTHVGPVATARPTVRPRPTQGGSVITARPTAKPTQVRPVATVRPTTKPRPTEGGSVATARPTTQARPTQANPVTTTRPTHADPVAATARPTTRTRPTQAGPVATARPTTRTRPTQAAPVTTARSTQADPTTTARPTTRTRPTQFNPVATTRPSHADPVAATARPTTRTRPTQADPVTTITPPTPTTTPAELGCQLTEEQQQQLIDDAMAQHATNEALYQQLLLKALFEQAVSKADSALLDQKLSGQTGLSPQNVADLIRNGTVSPTDVAMAALQAAGEFDQETGGHSSQGTTCDEGSGQGQGAVAGNGDPNPTSNRADSADQGQQGQGQEGQQGKGRITEPEPGLWDSIDPHAQVAGWTFTHLVDVDSTTGEVAVTTDVTQTSTGQTGSVTRSYDPMTHTLTMELADLDRIPSGERWVQTTPSMGESTTGNLRGTPLQAYVTMSQMKLIEDTLGSDVFAEPYNVHMSRITNAQTMLELAQLENDGVPMDVAIAQTHSLSYASTPIVQSGGQISDIRVVNGFEMSASVAAAAFRETPLNPADYGLSRSDMVLADFDIDFKVTPRPGGVPHLPGQPGSTP